MTILVKGKAPRRTVLRGMLNGAAVSVALPFLDTFLNDNGTALASGERLPVRFGTWFWGLGYQPGFGIDEKAPGIELLNEAKPLERHKARMNYFSGFNAALDGKANVSHYSGLTVARTGSAPLTGDDMPAPTFDVLISDSMGNGTRFRSLNMAATGGARNSYSARSAASRNASEVSPVGLYAKVFGPEFVDPNKAEFKPDPRIMIRQSVLSGVADDSKRLMTKLGSSSKARLDEYFTSIRELENQLALQSQKPPPNEACRVQKSPDDMPIGSEMYTVLDVNAAMAKILAMAVACDQTRTFNLVFSNATSGLLKTGLSGSHHSLSHEEPVDPKLGYQPVVAWFNIRSMEGLATFVDAFADLKEGDGTLLDNTLLVAHSDTNDAKTHQLDGIPILTFGKAGGRIKNGLHVAGNGDPITRVTLTAMQIMGVPVHTWGTKSNLTSKSVSEILV